MWSTQIIIRNSFSMEKRITNNSLQWFSIYKCKMKENSVQYFSCSIRIVIQWSSFNLFSVYKKGFTYQKSWTVLFETFSRLYKGDFQIFISLQSGFPNFHFSTKGISKFSLLYKRDFQIRKSWAYYLTVDLSLAPLHFCSFQIHSIHILNCRCQISTGFN